MPLTRPAEISDGVSLSHKLGREPRPFVAKDRAFNALLGGDCVVDIFSPDEHGATVGRSEDDMSAGADELISRSPVSVLVGAVMSLIEREA